MLSINDFAACYVDKLVADYRQKHISAALRRYPNLFAMSVDAQVECIADVLGSSLARHLQDNIAMRDHGAAYEQFLDA